MKKKRFPLAVKTVLTTGVLLLFSSLTAQAAYEVSTSTVTSDVPIGTTAVQYTNDFLQVNWDNPTISNPDQGPLRLWWAVGPWCFFTHEV